MSTVTELATQAKDDPSIMPLLWDGVRRLVALWANKYIQYAPKQGNRLYDVDDLIQSGYLALVDAVAGYDSEVGAFTTYLNFHIRRHFAKVSGRYGTKRRPELDAASLDIPFGEDNDTTRADLLADPAVEFVDDVIEKDALHRDFAAVMLEINKLPEELCRAFMLVYWHSYSPQKAAEVMGITPQKARRYRDRAVHKIRNSATGRRIREDRYPFRHVTLTSFKNTRTSSVEWAILRMEERGWFDFKETETEDATDK